VHKADNEGLNHKENWVSLILNVIIYDIDGSNDRVYELTKTIFNGAIVDRLRCRPTV